MGCWIVWAEIGPRHVGLLMVLKTTLLYKNKKEGGSARASPVATSMPKSVSF